MYRRAVFFWRQVAGRISRYLFLRGSGQQNRSMLSMALSRMTDKFWLALSNWWILNGVQGRIALSKR
jgi:hypothetical protein